MLPQFMYSFPTFFFSVFSLEKDRISFIFSKMNVQLVIHIPVTYIGEILLLLLLLLKSLFNVGQNVA